MTRTWSDVYHKLRLLLRLRPPDLKLQRLSSKQDHVAYGGASGEASMRREYERSLIPSDQTPFTLAAYCYPCRRVRKLSVDFQYASIDSGRAVPNWRESLICHSCGLNNRLRAAVQLSASELAGADGRFYLTEQSTALYRYLNAKYASVIGSEYLGPAAVRGGTSPSGLRHEDLTSLTFPDEAFDAVLSFDVLEHIPEFAVALAEIARVVRRGGRLLLSVPFDAASERTVIRARVDSSGAITHLVEPEYHGDPLSPHGILCFQTFGWDLLDHLRSAGFSDATAIVYWSAELGYLGDQVMFVAYK